MRRTSATLAAAFAALLASAASAAAAGGGIYVKINSIPGTVMAQGHEHWIEALTFQVGGQVVSATAPYALTLPPGTKSVTFTKKPDASSGGLSAAFASKRQLVDVQVDIVHPNLDARGAPVGPQHTLLHLNSPTIGSFTSTGAVQTVVLDLYVPPVSRPAADRSLREQRLPTPTSRPESRR